MKVIKILKNSISRLIAVQVLYSSHTNGNDLSTNAEHIDELLSEIIKSDDNGFANSNVQTDFIRELLERTLANREEIDELIISNLSKHKSISELKILLRAIVECAICELLYFNTPYRVVIDEYVKLAKDFFVSSEISFVNAILDKISKHIKK